MKAQPLSISSLPVIPSMRVIWADGLGSVVSSAEQRQIEQGRPKRPEWNESSLHVCTYSLCDHRKWLIEPSTVVRMDIREFKWKGYLLGSALDLLLQSSIASNFSSRNETGIDVGKVSSVPLRSFINTFFFAWFKAWTFCTGTVQPGKENRWLIKDVYIYIYFFSSQNRCH